MKQFLIKPYRWAILFSCLLPACFAFVLLDTFVIPRALEPAAISAEADSSAMESAESGSTTSTAEQESEEAASSAAITDTSYEDEQIQITIDTEKTDNTTFYVADIQVSDASYLKTALAGDTYGRNIKAATSETAGSNGAILAINGDYYGFRDEGYVLRNGVLYRDTARNSEEDDALVIDIEGNFSIISENETSLSSIDTSSIAQILSFGPSLIEDGEITVDGSSEVSRSMSGNPRTAIGQIDPLHYIIIVSDGRTSESEGLSLLELAEEMQERGAETAYNLDGGGSSTLYFNGEIINNPTDGREMGEREVSDIVYIGY
ncbi:phosphodiester glycosidase family protein [Planomicrobium sp. CPCC 101079]|nr:phosphodiester glycosidase family protein [Planomicrobium sp. CPCC 101079]